MRGLLMRVAADWCHANRVLGGQTYNHRLAMLRCLPEHFLRASNGFVHNYIENLIIFKYLEAKGRNKTLIWLFSSAGSRPTTLLELKRSMSGYADSEKYMGFWFVTHL